LPQRNSDKPSSPRMTKLERGQAPKPSERDIQRACTEILEWDGWRAIRTEHAIERDPKTGKVRRRVGEVGMPDYLYLRYEFGRGAAEVMWVEWKTLRGGVSTKQLMWAGNETLRGACVLIAGEHFPATIEGFREWYATSGLQRKTRAKA